MMRSRLDLCFDDTLTTLLNGTLGILGCLVYNAIAVAA
jgi:hypothetical protein